MVTELSNLKLTCLRCGTTWFRRVDHPKLCPSCHSPYWDKPKVKAQPAYRTTKRLPSPQQRELNRIADQSRLYALEALLTSEQRQRYEVLLEEMGPGSNTTDRLAALDRARAYAAYEEQTNQAAKAPEQHRKELWG